MGDDITAAIMSGVDVGDSFVAGGTQMTACIVGDGFGLHMNAAGTNTSCEFARAVQNAQTNGLNATEDNIRDHLMHYVRVTSPVTGKAYDMECSTKSDRVIVCTGGNDANVYMY